MTDVRTLPKWEAQSFASWAAKATEKYFENPDVQRRFEAWQREREKKKKEVN